MTLSPEMRQQLLARAGELRTEVTSLTAERDAALTDQSQSVEDAKLIAEVQRLEHQAEEARRQRDYAVNNTGAAVEIMERLIQEQAARDAASAPAEGTTKPGGDLRPEEQDTTVDAAVESVDTSRSTARNKNGGSR